jgi:hypothetical protein
MSAIGFSTGFCRNGRVGGGDWYQTVVGEPLSWIEDIPTLSETLRILNKVM